MTDGSVFRPLNNIIEESSEQKFMRDEALPVKTCTVYRLEDLGGRGHSSTLDKIFFQMGPNIPSKRKCERTAPKSGGITF